MSLKIYNSLTNKLEEFVPKNKDVVYYQCTYGWKNLF